MKEEQIEKAALLFAGAGEFGECPYNPDAKNGFMAGAQWRINSVWHSADEEPETGRLILVRKRISHCQESYQLKLKEALPYWENTARFVGEWAYLRDLLPDKSTENAENFPQNSADFPRKFRECRKTSSDGKEAE